MPIISEFPIAGPQGKQGPIGPQGKQGPEGKRGPMGPAGPGTGDMLAMVYDPQGKATDVYKYVDDAAAGRADLTLSNLSNRQKALRNIGGRPNKNLLGNAYFKGGGSQQGGGQFPINQRGKTSWSQGSAFDRWLISKSSSSDAIVTLSEGGVSASAQCWFFERLDGKDLVGKQLTLSALLDSNELIFGTVTFNKQNSVAVNNGEFSLYMENRPNTTFTVFVISWIKGSGKKVVAAKLELGDQQTLAYQDEDGNWQLFETPDYAEELAKCQRYLFNPLMGGLEWSQIMYGYAYSDTAISCTLTLPVNMRTLPAIIQSGDFRCVGAGIVLEATGFNVVDCSGNTIRIDVCVSGAKADEVYVFMRDNDSASKLLLSAEL